MDFNILTYRKLLDTLLRQGFSFQTFAEYIDTPNDKSIVLRHDVDARKENSLQFARIQYKMGIVGTYNFRIIPQSFDEKVIEEIAGLGHEIGYHYETIDTLCKKTKDKSPPERLNCLTKSILRHLFSRADKKTKVTDYDLLVDTAYEEFCRNLEIFRKIVPVVTICMHGSPLSKYDNRAIWMRYDYKKPGIIAEPYFDVNFEDVLYLTDTGRRWDGGLVSMRDKGLGIRDEGPDKEVYSDWKVKPLPGSLMSMSQKSISFQNRFKFRSTRDIIRSAEKGELPDKMMMTFHPQRWTDKPIPWVKELIWQNVKNVGKYFLVKLRN